MKKGFTLIELLVVIAIIALLSSIVMASLSGARARARYAEMIESMRQIKVAAESVYATTGAYPNDVGIDVLPPALAPYLKEWPSSSCKNYVYDWNNVGGNNVNVDIRLVSPSSISYRYCIYSSTGNCGDTNIMTIEPKQISC